MGLQIYWEETMNSRTCVIIMVRDFAFLIRLYCLIQILPIFGASAGSFAVLSIGIDRFISIAMPNRYREMNVTAYLLVR